jgi:exodeoxyribonuclease VII large subunit
MQVFSVSELTTYLRDIFEGDPILSDIWIEGEVSNWSRASSGHCYWTLREGDMQLRAVCWRQQVLRQSSLPTNGDQVLVHGRVSFWEGNGQVQIYTDLIRPAGIGVLHAQVEALKQRLAAEGLFDMGRKRAIPSFPLRIGIVTSPMGAALQDMLIVLRQRWPLGEVVLAPAQVQGDGAPYSLVEALFNLYELKPDLVIVARGGGSIEDLWAFNDESVVRAIFASPVPVITGVGHETDTTVVDYVADVRAPTPSVAAALATPDIADLREQLQTSVEQLYAAMEARLDNARIDLAHLTKLLQHLDPRVRLVHNRQIVDQLHNRLDRSLQTFFAMQKLQLAGLHQQIETLSPRRTLARGYAVVRRENGAVVLSPSDVVDGEAMVLELRDGTLKARADSQLTERSEVEAEVDEL